ncbi:MAG: Fe-S protein assembly co-chaperone HscB [Pseudomonadota bacterium]
MLRVSPPVSHAAPDALDHYALFGLEPRFALDEAALDRAYRDLQSRVHPDRYAAATAPERRVAMQWAARANEAYQTLRAPLARAAYLCERRGAAVQAESNTAMPAGFLMQQMQWREALDEARAAGDEAALAVLRDEVRARRDQTLHAVARALDDDADPARAAALVRELMFIEKFGQEVAAVDPEH